MSVSAVLQQVGSIEKRLDELLVRAGRRVDPDCQPEFARDIKAARLRKNQELIQHLSKVASISGVWGAISEDVRQLDKNLEHERRRDELQHPDSIETLTAAVRWMTEQGREEDLRLLKQMNGSLEYRSDEIEKLCLIAIDRISERINDPYYVMSKGEEAYQKNREQWEVEYAGRFVAIQGGKVIDSDPDKSELVERIIQRQREEGPSRSFIVEVGAPVIEFRGSKATGRIRRTAK